MDSINFYDNEFWSYLVKLGWSEGFRIRRHGADIDKLNENGDGLFFKFSRLLVDCMPLCQFANLN